MRTARIGGLRRFVLVAAVLAVCSTLGLFVFLPYDSAVLSFFRFTSHRTVSFIGRPFRDEHWVFRQPDFPLDFEKDVGLILKTGYGTQARIGAQLDALGPAHDTNMIVIADFAGDYNHSGRSVPIHDMVAATAASPAAQTIAGSEQAARIERHSHLTAAIRAGNLDEASRLAKSVGWELDALKFMPGLELSYQRLPHMKWYVMVDDDTYLIKPSMRALLGHLDPSSPMYVGNAIGDFKGRFAHGGSAIILSRPAMELLFERNRPALEQAFVESLTETWGDKLVATTFMKIGVYLDERYSHFFNGERPLITRILPDRFCSPLVSFHGLANPVQMAETTGIFRDVDRPILWGELWGMYGQPSLRVFDTNPIRRNRDHVGPGEEAPDGFGSVEACVTACEAQLECLAWTWDKPSSKCRTSHWFSVGDEPEAKFSGLNVARVRKLHDSCPRLATPE